MHRLLIFILAASLTVAVPAQRNRRKSAIVTPPKAVKPTPARVPVAVRLPNVAGSAFRYANFPSNFAAARNVDVWLPPDYAINPGKRYPVLYMHDGQMLFDGTTTWNKQEWRIDETMTRLIAEKKIRPAIVVGVWNTAERVIEYAPQKAYDAVNRRNIKASPLIKPKEGLSDKYLKFIVGEIKPFIDRNYRTLPGRENTFVAGSSMGGLMSLYAISEYPNVFGAAACISTHFPLGNGVIIEYMKKSLPAPKLHRIYFDHGTTTLDAQYEPYQQKADAVMKKRGYKKNKDWVTLKFEGADHTENSWAQRAEYPLVFLLGK